MPYTRTDEGEGRLPATGAVPPAPRHSKPIAPALVLAVGFFTTVAPSLPAQTAAPSAADSRVHALGRLEPTSGLITVGSRPGQRIDEVKVSVGDVVTAGQVLAVLEGREQAQAQLALAGLQKRQMEFQRDARKKKLDLEREQFTTTHALKLKAATTVAGELRKLLNQVEGLWKISEGAAALTGAAPDRQKLEDNGRYLELLAKTTQAELDKSLLEAEADLTKKKQTLEADLLTLNEPPKPDNPEFLLPDAQIALAKSALKQTEVVAPRDGTILDVLGRVGEVGSGQLLVMGDLTAMTAVAEVFQSEVGRVSVGDPATVSIFDQSATGKVTRVGSLVGRNQAANLDPRALKDVRVVKVWIALDDPKAAAKLVNMEAEVAIAPGGGR